MDDSTVTATGALAELDLLRIEHAGAVTHVRLNRPVKRNALNDTLVAQLQAAFTGLPAETRAVVLSGEGSHFSAGLDLSELSERSVAEAVVHSRSWHAAFEHIQFGRVPVVAVMHGAVVGGGLELAVAAHIRVAERSVFYGLPEGQRGIFVEDNANPTGGFSTANYQALSDQFDAQIYATDVSYFGTPPDGDSNSRIVIVITKTAPRRGARASLSPGTTTQGQN